MKNTKNAERKQSQTSKSVDPITPLTLIYDSVTLPIKCKCMYRKSSRKIARVNKTLNDLQINLTCSAGKTDKIIPYSKLATADYLLKLSGSSERF